MKRNEIDQHIGRLLTRLQKLQKPDGSWADNNFVTALVACSLAEVRKISAKPKREIADILIEKTIDSILSQKSEGWSWNYQPTKYKSKGKKEMPGYPDDLDDTFCSLIAIFKIQPNLLKESVLTHIAQLLMNTEIKEGGPYNTWIVRKDLKKSLGEIDNHWHDIDPAVNANISYFLSLVGISLPRLTGYLDRTIRTGIFHSKYYHNRLMTLYFLSRGYAGKEKIKLIKNIHDAAKTESDDGLNAALIVCSLLRLGEPSKEIKPYLNRLLVCNKISSDECLYIEKKNITDTIYAQSKAFSIAIRMEAMSLYIQAVDRENREKIRVANTARENSLNGFIVKKMTSIIAAMPPNMRFPAKRLFLKTITGTASRKIILFPLHISSHLKNTKKNIPGPYLANLSDCCVIGLLGWISYTLYDDILDKNENIPASKNPSKQLLPIANFFCRHMNIIAFDLMGESAMFLFKNIMNTLDIAEYRESNNFKINPNIQADQPILLPPEHIVWGKSAGVMLPAICVLLKAGYDRHSRTIKYFRDFFKEYLYVRQIADDIRDWEEDMAQGIITRVTARILVVSQNMPRQKSEDMHAPSASETLRNIFLSHALIPASQEIIRHANLAKKILAIACMKKAFTDTTFLMELIAPYETSAIIVLKNKSNHI